MATTSTSTEVTDDTAIESRAAVNADAPSLVAIVRAARSLGDRELERNARRQLADHYGIELTFRRGHHAVGRGARQ